MSIKQRHLEYANELYMTTWVSIKFKVWTESDGRSLVTWTVKELTAHTGLRHIRHTKIKTFVVTNPFALKFVLSRWLSKLDLTEIDNMGEGPLTDHNSPISDRDDSAETRKKRRGKLLFYVIFSHIGSDLVSILGFFRSTLVCFIFSWLMKNLEIIVNITWSLLRFQSVSNWSCWTLNYFYKKEIKDPH